MNKELDQDRVFDTFDHYKRFGFVLFPENKQAYNFIKDKVKGSVLEAGCGQGTGAYIIGADIATDKLEKNIKFARELYPNIEFDVWDISKEPYKKKADTVVCVEAIEHVEDVKSAIKNMIASANKEVWFSTPNRKDEHPDNPYHVREYSKEEMLELIGDYKVEVVEIGSSALYHIYV